MKYQRIEARLSDYPDDADGDALRRVASTADMSTPMAIDFEVVAETREALEAIARVAEARGYQVELREEDAVWCCTCTRTMLATYDGVMGAQAELDALAEPFGGSTDGWGTFGNR